VRRDLRRASTTIIGESGEVRESGAAVVKVGLPLARM
jgi:hypothetical protein